MPADPRWSCARKYRFPTERDAKRAAARIRRQQRAGDHPITHYGCVECGGWHVGHDRKAPRIS